MFRHGLGQQFIHPVHWMLRNPLEHVPQVRLRVEVIELARADQAVHRGAPFTAAVLGLVVWTDYGNLVKDFSFVRVQLPHLGSAR